MLVRHPRKIGDGIGRVGDGLHLQTVGFIKALTEAGLPAFLMYRLHVAPGHISHQQFDRVGANINYRAADRLHERV